MSQATTSNCPADFGTQRPAVQKIGRERLWLVDAERQARPVPEPPQAPDLGEALAIAKAEVTLVRAQSEAVMEAAREAVMRAREEAGRLRLELQVATETANSARAREATLRNELATAREQFQQIVDRQTLQLLELTRELSPRPSSPAPVPTRTTGTRDDTVVCFDAIDAVLAASPL